MSLPVSAQSDFRDTTWFNNDWEISPKNNATFYRVYQTTTSGYLVYDKYADGETQMVAEASAIKPELIKEGKTTYFYKKGVKDKTGTYVKNVKSGTWIQYFNAGKDSSITLYKEDGTQEMIRRSSFEEIFTIVESSAEFPGGIPAMMKFIQSNIKYPATARETYIGGKVFMKFVVTEEGAISDIEVLKGTGHMDIDNEAIRVVNAMPIWKAAQMSGTNVKCYFNLPLSFSLDTPYFIFNTNNKNENYLLAKEALLNDNREKALEFYFKDTADIEAWFNMAVIYFHKKQKAEAKKYFENVKNNISDTKNQFYVLSNKFLTNSF